MQPAVPLGSAHLELCGPALSAACTLAAAARLRPPPAADAVPRAERVPHRVPGLQQDVGRVSLCGRCCCHCRHCRCCSNPPAGAPAAGPSTPPALLRSSAGPTPSAACPLQHTAISAESSARSDNFYEVDVPVKGHRSLEGEPAPALRLLHCYDPRTVFVHPARLLLPGACALAWG